VVVTSDHGEEFLEHGSWEHQKTLYEEVVRVPLVVRAPGVPARRDARQASLLDVAPTVLAWAGVAGAREAVGRDLLLAPAGAAARDTDPIQAYGETDHTDDRTHRLFLRGGQGRWKAIFSLAPEGGPAGAGSGGRVLKEEWYDLAADPGELRSAAPRAEIADAIRAQAVSRWREGRGRGGRSPDVSLTEQQREELRALGYVSP
jgi:arylsulfatase A-like enzyme